MNWTAGKVVKAALQALVTQGAEADMEAVEYADGFIALNAMMAAWKADGVDLGFTDVDNVGDTMTVPNGAIRGIIANLAIEMAPDYDRPVPQALAARADKGYKTCLKIAQTVIPTAFPSTLPRGSGNDTGFPRTDPYYSDREVTVFMQAFKDPDATDEFTVPWQDKLIPLGDTISSSDWVVDSGVTEVSDSNTTLEASIVVSGGTAGGIYNLTNRIVTAGGLTLDRTIALRIEES